MRWRRGYGWRLLDARSGSSRDFPIADDRPWIVQRSRGQSSVVLPLMLPSVLPGLGATLPPRNRVRACKTQLSLSATPRRHLPECRPDEAALPKDARGFGREPRLPPADEQHGCSDFHSNALIARRARVSQPGDPEGPRTDHARRSDRVHSTDIARVVHTAQARPAESPPKMRALRGVRSPGARGIRPPSALTFYSLGVIFL